jgi:hypothetical protein
LTRAFPLSTGDHAIAVGIGAEHRDRSDPRTSAPPKLIRVELSVLVGIDGIEERDQVLAIAPAIAIGVEAAHQQLGEHAAAVELPRLVRAEGLLERGDLALGESAIAVAVGELHVERKEARPTPHLPRRLPSVACILIEGALRGPGGFARGRPLARLGCGTLWILARRGLRQGRQAGRAGKKSEEGGEVQDQSHRRISKEERRRSCREAVPFARTCRPTAPA